MAAPVEGNATDLSENEMTNETVAEATEAAGTAPDMLLHFQHEVRVEVARTRLTGKEITQITSGSIIELDKLLENRWNWFSTTDHRPGGSGDDQQRQTGNPNH